MLELKPSPRHLETVKRWLEAEEAKEGESFIVNWTIIEECFKRACMAVYLIEDDAVAFFVWAEPGWQERVIHGLILAIEPSMRRRGIGRTLIGAIERKFATQSILALKLEAFPRTSELFWRDLGYQPSEPDIPVEQFQPLSLYKALASDDVGALDSGECLWLWHKDIWSEKTDSDPALRACIDRALVTPAKKDWRAAIVDRNGSTIAEDRLRDLVTSPECFSWGLLAVRPDDWAHR